MNTNQTLSHGNLLTGCKRSMRYHHERARFFNKVHLFIQFLVFALASASVSRLLDTLLTDHILLWLLATIGLLGLLSLVYNPAENASLHKSLYRGFTMLNGTVSATLNPDEATLTEWTKSLYSLYAEEPPVYCALLVHCSNQVVIVLDADRKYLVKLHCHQKWFRNIFSFQGTEFLNQEQASS